MSRFRRVVHSVASGYAVLIATALYALVSIPLALHYLSKKEFGLWGLMASISSYLSLIDLGMSGSVARLLIDYKDEAHGGKYGAFIKTGWIVLAVQGLCVFVLGWTLAPLLSTLLNIPVGLEGQFIPLMRWQGTILALSFALRLFSHLLNSHQRLDITNYIQIGTLAISFGAQWIFFERGSGVFSLVWAMLISTGLGGIASWLATWKLRFYPRRGEWGKASWKYFVELFAYGKDLFLVAVGTQLIMASQTMIITRRLGLEAAAAWYAGTRAFNLVSQAIWRISDSSAPAFSEMIVRREMTLLRERYRTILTLTASASGFAAVTYALCNSVFVSLLSHGKIQWPAENDLLLGVWIIVMSILRCHNCFVLLTKEIGFMRYVYFLEGGVYVAAALMFAKWGGLPAIVLCSIVCSLSFSGAYGTWRISNYFRLSLWEVSVRWLTPMGQVLLLFAPLSIAGWYFFREIENPYLRLVTSAVYCGLVGSYILLRMGISEALQGELLQRAPKRLNPILRRMFLGWSQ